MAIISPMEPIVLTATLETFRKVSYIMMGFVSCAFLLRAVILQVGLSSAWSYGELFKNTVAYFAFIMVFPLLVKTLMDASAGIANSISYIPPSDAQAEVERFIKSVLGGDTFLYLLGKFGDLILEYLAIGFYTVCLAVLIAAAPVIIFNFLILDLGAGVKPFFSCLVAFSLYPVLWNIFGLLGKQIWPFIKTQPLTAVFFWIAILLLQLFSPAFCAALFMKGSMQRSIEKAATKVN